MRLMIVGAVVVMAVAFAGCTAANDESGQSASASDENEFLLTGNLHGSTTRSTEFENSLPRVEYAATTNLGGGSLTFTIRDATGTSVASFTISGTGQDREVGTSRAGTPGTWTVTVKAENASGQFHVVGHGVD